MRIVEIAHSKLETMFNLSDNKHASDLQAEIPMKNKFFTYEQAMISLKHRPFGGKNLQ